MIKNISGLNQEIKESLLDITVSYNLDDKRYIVVNNYNNIFVPLSIFKGQSCASILVWFLKMHNLSFSEIAKILNRDQRTIWSLYNRLEKKRKEIKIQNCFDDYYIPIEIFSYRGLSILESIVFWLKIDKNLSYSYISKLLGKNYQTIRTVYLRSLKKVGSKYEKYH